MVRASLSPRRAAQRCTSARANFRKHGVRFSDAEAALLDSNAITRDDATAEDERRFVSLGLDLAGRVVVVAPI